MRARCLVSLGMLFAACDPYIAREAVPDLGPSIAIDRGLVPAPERSAPPLDAGGTDADSPALIKHKGIWIWSSTIRGSEAATAAWLAKHSYTDVFVLIKGTSGTFKFDVLDKLIALKREQRSALRVWAWMVGFQDKSHTSSSWTYVVNDWVSPADPDYHAHLAEIAERAVNPSRGDVSYPPDGLVLDDSFQWPSQKWGTSTANRVKTLMTAVDAIRSKVNAASEQHGQKIWLGFAPHPETAVQSTDGNTVTSYAAYAYGQDLGELAKRCDWIIPETYRYGFYNEPVSWIGTTVSNIKKEIERECPERASSVHIFPALVLYNSDTNTAPVSATNLAADRSAALSAAGGYSVFRYASGAANPGVADATDWPTASQLTVLDNE